MELPLFDGDFDAPGIIEPTMTRRPKDVPEAAVLCFFGDIVGQLPETHDATRAARLRSEIGINPVWEIEHRGQRLAVVQPGIGAPLAAIVLEELIVLGVRRFIACGGAGALVPELTLGHAVVVDSAVRDEGTSFHYQPAAPTIEADEHARTTLVKTLARQEVAHLVGHTWTTDAIYRETRTKAQRRVAEGCVVVDMEASALMAVAQYRTVMLGHLLLAGDTLAGENWDARGWTTASTAREKLFWLAADAAVEL